MIRAGMTWLPLVICWMTCGLEYSPWSASVAIVVACSSTVSDAWPSAVTGLVLHRACHRPLALTSTPNAVAMLTTGCWPVAVLYATRCHRSV